MSEWADNYDQFATYQEVSSSVVMGAFTLTLYDSYGDGGGSVTISGVTYTLDTGFSQSFEVQADAAGITDVSYLATDSWSSENSWDITDADGTVLASGVNADGVLDLTPDSADGPVCQLADCMSDWADNYDANATTDDGSCDKLGCTSDWADNYDSIATTDDGSCSKFGCTSEWADNYDNLANTEIGGATFAVSAGGGSYSYEMSWEILDCSGMIIASGGAGEGSLILPGTYTINMYDSFGDGWSGNTLVIGEMVYGADFLAGADATAFVGDCASPTPICQLADCMSDWADNYDANATTDDGSCDRLGCMSNWATNFDPIATTDNGLCQLDGCTSSWATNYDGNATDDNGTCQLDGCTSIWATNYDGNATDDNGTCQLDGCTSGWATNYDGNATDDNGTCQLDGCMNINSDNYDGNATDDNGSCYRFGCTNPDSDNYDGLATDDSGDCFRMGCTNDWADNYDALATVADGSCTVFEIEYYTIALGDSINVLNDDLDVLGSQYDIVVNQYANLELAYDSCYAYGASIGGPVEIPIDILEGWNMIGYTLPYAQDAAATLSEISDIVLIAKNNGGSVYWPELGFNGCGDLMRGNGYQIKTTGSFDQFTFPDVDGQRIIMTPTVPDWAIEMEVDIHPNDIRTLVKVVNMIGQEVNVADQFSGEVLLYLYNDGSVEKKIVK
jgi:hypothetical protein